MIKLTCMVVLLVGVISYNYNVNLVKPNYMYKRIPVPNQTMNQFILAQISAPTK